MKKTSIKLHRYSGYCWDGCCYEYWTIVTVDWTEMPYHNDDTWAILEQVLWHLWYTVELEETDSGADIQPDPMAD